MKSNGIFLYKDKCRVLNFFLGGFLLRKNQAIRGSAIAPAASLASLSPVATFGAPTILATFCKSNTQN